MAGHDPCQKLVELLTTMRALRAPDGCPWDAGQTPESLTPYLLEEACEVIEAIETGSPEMVADELGDLLLQVVFQAQIFSERGHFDFADVAEGINAKLVRRHPHVFAANTGAVEAENLDRQWERIKREERAAHHKPERHPLDSLPNHLPALQRAQKLVARAMRQSIDPLQAFPQQPARRDLTAAELGTALLYLVRDAEFSGLDAEQVLRQTLRSIRMTGDPDGADIDR